MKHLKKFNESKEEIDDQLRIVRGSIKMISNYDKLEISDMLDAIDY